jgi:hypothetical protein
VRRRQQLLKQEPENELNGLSLGLLNCRSLNNKCEAVKRLIIDEHLDVVALTETWLRDECDSHLIVSSIPPGYNALRCDRIGKKGGGVALLFSPALRARNLTDINVTFKSFEILFTELASATSTAKSCKLRIAIIYRPPCSKTSIFLSEFETLLSNLNDFDDTVIVGDLNIHVDDTSNPVACSFKNIYEQYSWSQVIQEPTHDSGHTLDLMLIKMYGNAQVISDTIKTVAGVSDHMAVLCKLSIARPPLMSEWRTLRNFNKVNKESFWNDFWENYRHMRANANETLSINLLWRIFHDCAMTTLSKHAKQKRVKIRKRINKMTEVPFDLSLIRLKRGVRNQEKRWRKTRLTIDKEMFQKARNEYISKIREAKERRVKKVITDCKTTSRQRWQILAQCTGHTLKGARRVDSKYFSVDECQSRAKSVAKFFHKKVEQINAQLGPHIVIPERSEIQFQTNRLLIDIEHTTAREIKDVIRRFSSQKGSIDDPIPVKLLKHNSKICHLFSEMCNSSFASATFPHDLKQVLITPVLKKMGLDENELKNYRPISNMKVSSKIIECIAANRLVSHLESTGFLHKFQSAYRKFHSTETATVKVLSDWRSAIDRGEKVVVASLDVTAAFDTVNHEILLFRLMEAGVAGSALRWFTSYLESRLACVKFRDAVSQPFPLKSGVPQGSILGPCLFNCYMRDLAVMLESLCCVENRASFHIYADDVLLYVYCPPDSSSRSLSIMEMLLKRVEEWMKTNGLLLNMNKTEIILLRGSRSKAPPEKWTLMVGGQPVEIRNTGSFKWLGVDFDVNLDMGSFVQRTCCTCYGMLRMTRRIRDSLDWKSAKLFCEAVILSRIDYCIMLIYSVAHFDRLQKVINLAARVISRKNRHDHISHVLTELEWLRAPSRAKFKTVIMVYKALQDCAPTYLRDALRIYTPTRQLRSSDSTAVLLVLGEGNSRYGKISWAASAPSTWNKLPGETRNLKLSYGKFYDMARQWLLST